MKFFKYEGCGNHFILLDRVIAHVAALEITPALVSSLCEPHFGIGGDGVLVIDQVHPPESVVHSIYRMTVYNADGSSAEMCGNGLRCVGRYLQRYNYFGTGSESTIIQTGAGPLPLAIRSDGMIGVQMGWPTILESVQLSAAAPLARYSLGNPHLVTYNSEHTLDRLLLAEQWSTQIAGGINISFAEQLSPRAVKLSVHERGCGWTMACGTGACATIYDGYLDQRFSMGETITVSLPGGDLEIEITEGGLLMWGPAKEIYSGQLSEELLESLSR